MCRLLLQLQLFSFTKIPSSTSQIPFNNLGMLFWHCPTGLSPYTPWVTLPSPWYALTRQNCKLRAVSGLELQTALFLTFFLYFWYYHSCLQIHVPTTVIVCPLQANCLQSADKNSNTTNKRKIVESPLYQSELYPARIQGG